MRRPAPTGPLSPKLIKHFAAVTIALTGLLAMFASGEDWGARAQIGSVNANNQVLMAEAEQLGARPLAARIKIQPGPSRGGFDAEPSYDFGEGGGNSGPAPAPQQPVHTRNNHSTPPLGLASSPDTTMTVISGPTPAEDPLQTKAKNRPKSVPTAQQMSEITANSARRSGQSGELD